MVVKLGMRSCEGREKESDGRVLHDCGDSCIVFLCFSVFDSRKTSFRGVLAVVFKESNWVETRVAVVQRMTDMFVV